ncbi:type I-B CRISPR-associated protein Cas7/Csh2 [Marinilabilia sp.]|uniref:type I-B CRISPR-associated protein Cas7/Csh2 n=1 Tax=Marinilabilia sp. TaxID=2021252 RepID=UPI0025C6B637|nr:type I-B CRISPR-associated protein Cas7/Csh2 [Marinilabilia sp.]
MANAIEKSEILFLFESKYTIPNGDPFTGEQRYDEETKRILVSDVRIKRYVRDHFIAQNFLSENNEKYTVYVFNDRSQVTEGKNESGASARMQVLWNGKKPKDKKEIPEAALKLMQSCIDVRLFGGISTEKEAAVNITGPVQFALLNPSLNKADLRIHQNTSVFSSSTEKSRGAIGTTTVVPYAINQIHGWINPYSAQLSGLKSEDISELFSAMWKSLNNINTRSKSNQSSVILIQIVYNEPDDKLYGTDSLISIESEKEEEQIRSMEDYSFNFEKLAEATKSPKVKEIRFYTEIEDLKKVISGLDPKFKEMEL